MSKVEVDQVDPQSGTNLTLGTSGDSILIPSGVTLANSGTMTGVPVPTTGIAASAISSGTIATARLGSGTASGTTFLAGDQTYKEAGGAITMAAQWRVTADSTGTHDPINSNWEAGDTDGSGVIGSNMSESSGIFTFPSTGIYYIELQVSVSTNASLYNNIVIKTTSDNSSYGSASEGYVFLEQNSQYSSSTVSFIFDVTNTSTHKVRFVSSPQDTSAKMMGDTHNHRTGATFIRLGDT